MQLLEFEETQTYLSRYGTRTLALSQAIGRTQRGTEEVAPHR